MLLVLDNMEQLVAGAAVVGRLLDAAPRLTVLTTSRIPLHVAGEQEFPLAPLAVPDLLEPGDVDAIGRNEAVRLFVERSARVRPDFQLTPQNAPAVGQIAARLDGLPLAIELAAGRARALDPDALLARLETRLSVLTGGARDLPARQQTLRAALDWSYDLLQPDEQRLFACLAPFSGGWTLAAAEAVCAAGLRISVLDGLDSLVDQSLVRVQDDPPQGVRFSMLETIREYAADRLTALGERDDARRRHATYFLAWAEGEGASREGASREGDAASTQRVELERDNVRAALGWAAEAGEAEIGLRLATAVWTYWPRHDLTEGRTWLERILALPQAGASDATRARALTTLGAIEMWRNDYERGRECLEEAAAIGREIRDPRLVAHANDSLEVLARAAGDLEHATALAREGLAAADEARDRALSAEFRGRLALIDVFKGNPGRAIQPLRDAVSVQREAGTRSQVALTLASLGTAELLAGDLPAVKRHFREALEISLDEGNLVVVGTMRSGAALLASAEGAHDRAARLIGAAARIRSDAGGGPLPEIQRRLGDPETEARRTLGDEAFERARDAGLAMATVAAVSYALGDEDPEADGIGEGASV